MQPITLLQLAQQPRPLIWVTRPRYYPRMIGQAAVSNTGELVAIFVGGALAMYAATELFGRRLRRR